MNPTSHPTNPRATHPWLQVLLAALLLTWATACATQTAPVLRGMRTPHAIALTCVGPDGKTLPVTDPYCTSDTVRAFVTGNGTLSLAVPSARTWIDTDPSAPGFTPLEMPGLPGALVIDAARGHAYVALPILGWVLRVDLAALATYDFKVLDWQDFGAPVEALLIAETPEPRLYMADPSRGGVWWVRLDTFAKTFGGSPVAPKFIATGGAPSSLALSPKNGHIYVGHLAAGFVSVIDPVGAALLPSVKQLSITWACNDGIDNDGDGLTDGDDHGCDDARDASEADPEVTSLCGDGKDNDGDGLTDAQDPGCSKAKGLNAQDACRNGIDDDGDGLTDYAPGGGDPGCSGWGDASEWSDRPLCGATQSSCVPVGGILFSLPGDFCHDGVDNDGDGHADADDPDCAVAGNTFESPPPCANGADDDGDGLVDALDPDCYNRASAAEVSQATAIRTVVASTFGGDHIVVADRTRRALLVIDAQTDTLLPVVPGQTTPFARASVLDVRDGIPGMSLPDMPLSLGAASVSDTIALPDGSTVADQPLMAIGLAQVGVQFLKFHAWGDLSTVSVDMWQVATDVTPTTGAGRPLLLIPGAVLDLPTTVPTRYAALGQLVLSTAADGTTVYYGLHTKADTTSHRSETWRFTAEGPLPGGVGARARLLQDGLLHDPQADFCRVGALPGDMLQVQLPATPACNGGGTYDFRITEVTQAGLAFDPTTGVLDVPVTNDNQLTYDTAVRKPFTSSLQACLGATDVHYVLRSQGWLVRGSRSGVLSSRSAVGGVCAPMDPLFASAGRLLEPTLRAGKSAADLAACPSAGEPLDQTLWQVPPFAHPVFAAEIKTGCDASTFDDSGNRIIHFVPTIREAEWVYGVTAAFSARTSAAGANPVGLASGPNMGIVYVIDEGAGLMQFVGIADGLLGTSPLD